MELIIFAYIAIVYGIVALSHLFIQLSLGHFDSLRISKTYQKCPSVAIIVPEYNESPKLFRRCIQSCLDLDYSGVYHVFAIDDGSPNKDAINLVSKLDSSILTAISLPQNVGKRRAQKAALDLINNDYEIVVTLDSDTLLAKDAITNLVYQFKDPKVAAITGNAVVLNRNHNILTKLIYSRYWVAFNIERASQSLFGSVLCCTGVISAYRTSVIQSLKERYVSQTFMGHECTYGDDRNLTNLVLSEGHKVVYEKDAIGYTDVPKTMKGYLKQQLRWNRSFYRELYITLKMVHKNPSKYPVYMLYDLIMQASLPIMLILAIMFMIFRAYYFTPLYIVGFLGTLIGVAILRSLYAVSRTNDTIFLLFPIYAFIHLFLLTPLRIYALFTLNARGWGTR